MFTTRITEAGFCFVFKERNKAVDSPEFHHVMVWYVAEGPADSLV